MDPAPPEGRGLGAAGPHNIRRGQAIRAVLQQIQYAPMPAADQIALFLATNEGLLDQVPEDKIQKAQEIIIKTLHQQFSGVISSINRREKIGEETKQKMIAAFQKALGAIK